MVHEMRASRQGFAGDGTETDGTRTRNWSGREIVIVADKKYALAELLRRDVRWRFRLVFELIRMQLVFVSAKQ